jgi:hypothetical protein
MKINLPNNVAITFHIIWEVFMILYNFGMDIAAYQKPDYHLVRKNRSSILGFFPFCHWVLIIRDPITIASCI